MIKLNCLESFIEKDYSNLSTFSIEPLETGQAVTLGNALRRVLLSDLTDYKIRSVRINDVQNEYAVMPSIREDVLEVLLNLKEILFKESVILHEKTRPLQNFILPAFILEKGPKIITAGMIKLPKNTLSILNPEQYICTLTKMSDFFCEMDISIGKSAQFVDDITTLSKKESFLPAKPKTIFLDTNHSPVQKVSFKVKLTYDSYGSLKEALHLTIVTRGTKSPKRCLYEGLKSLIDMCATLLTDSTLLELKTELSTDFLTPNEN